MQKSNRLTLNQNGAVLILMAFIIAIAATVYLVKSYAPNSIRAEQDKRTYLALNAAKKALIAWSAGHLYHPGQMPFPDRNTDGNYDGVSDCNSPTSTFNYSFLIGQLPVYGQNNPCTAPQFGVGDDYRDAQGNRLWYAVSRNLVHKYESPAADPIINPSIANSLSWLVVRDRNGQVISNRVAVVIIAPGNALSGQNRAGAAPDASQYLDSVNIGANHYSNANYDRHDEDFIIGQDSRDVTEADTSVTKPYYFNDKLVYITIDELMAAVTHRASTEAIRLLKQYRAKSGQFPYAAILGSALNNHDAIDGWTKGMLPIDTTDSCECSTATSCLCGFQYIQSVNFYRHSGTWNAALDAGMCTSTLDSTGKNCTCTGAGSCRRTTRSFTCSASGLCETVDISVDTLNKYTFKAHPHMDFYKASGGCTFPTSNLPRDELNCNDSGPFTMGLREPIWFKDNQWQDYFYYEWSPTSTLQVGEKAGVGAILIGTGGVLASTQAQPSLQIRPSSDIRHYLDSIQNTNNDQIFDATNKQKSNIYNDQTYIVMP